MDFRYANQQDSVAPLGCHIPTEKFGATGKASE